MREAASQAPSGDSRGFGGLQPPIQLGTPWPLCDACRWSVSFPPGNSGPRLRQLGPRRQGWGWGESGTGCRLAVRALPSGVQDHTCRAG